MTFDRRDEASRATGEPGGAARSPGKVPLTQRLAAREPRASGATGAEASASGLGASAPVPALDGRDDPFAFHLHDGAADVNAVAAAGVDGPGGALPHRATIQAAFGHHDLSDVRAHVGGRAAQATGAIGAEAYATGNDVAFARAPDLHTAAHEAAHVVQQRGGVQLYGGVGQVGDRYEQHADAVADAVVRGESAAPLLDTYASAGVGTTAMQRQPSHAVQRSPATAGRGASGGPDVVAALVEPPSSAGAYAARHWPQLRDAVRAALVAGDLAWEPPLRWGHGSPAEWAEAALAIVWPVVFVPAAWDPAFTRDIDEAIDLGLSTGTARQAQVAADEDRLARCHPAVGRTVGNAVVHQLQRSMRVVGPDHAAAHGAGGGGQVDAHPLSARGVSDRAAIALLAFVTVEPTGARSAPAPSRRGRGRRPTAARAEGTPHETGQDPDVGEEALVAHAQEQLVSIAGLVGEQNLDVLAPADTFLAGGPGPAPGEWRQAVARQGQRLEIIRGELLTLVSLSHRDVPLSLKADALAAYARAAGAAHLAEFERLHRLAREEVAEIDRRYAIAAAQAEAEAVEARDPASVGPSDLAALEARADRATSGRRSSAPPSTAESPTAVGAAGGVAASEPDLATDARASRVAAFRHGALRLADMLADARGALESARDLVSNVFTAHLAIEVEALSGEIAGVEALLRELVDDVVARAGRSGVALLEDTIVAEAEARFRDLVRASRVIELGGRVHAMLARVERASAIVATIGVALVMIGVSIAGGLAGAYVGGVVRGALTPAAMAATGETTTAAAVGGAVASVATESAIVGGFQTAISDESFSTAASENLLAAGFTFGALSGVRWAGVLSRAKATWAKGALARFLGPGATDVAVGMGANIVAHSLTNPGANVADDDLLGWTTNAASMILGRWLGTRLRSFHERLEAAGGNLGRDPHGLREVELLEREFRVLERELSDRPWSPEEYDALIDGRIAPLADRLASLERLSRRSSADGAAPANAESGSAADPTTPAIASTGAEQALGAEPPVAAAPHAQGAVPDPTADASPAPAAGGKPSTLEGPSSQASMPAVAAAHGDAAPPHARSDEPLRARDSAVKRQEPTDPSTWLAALEEGLTPDEVAKLGKMKQGKTLDEQRAMFDGDLEHARDKVRSAVRAQQQAVAVKAQSKLRIAEIERKIADAGLLADPEIRAIMLDVSKEPKEKIAALRDKVMAKILKTEAGAEHAPGEVLDGVKIYEKMREANLREWTQQHPRQQPAGLTERLDGLYMQRGEIDMMVLGVPAPGGRKPIIAREEIKTGALDTHAKAEAQLDDQARLLEQGARGEKRIRLERAGVDITDQIDLGSDTEATKSTRGPAGKGFDKSLGASASDLEGLFRRLLHEGPETEDSP